MFCCPCCDVVSWKCASRSAGSSNYAVLVKAPLSPRMSLTTRTPSSVKGMRWVLALGSRCLSRWSEKHRDRTKSS
ncbi:hypothetical protein BDP81DRAFT_416016 [Colletotrichum phormii]|uniref:Uncharacterized protein n=1 Tax=Colletotrichum phormii TaxID=359342 RepID=A0AAJ0A1V8_9PEZI|nr:uncharacterized protein BDP81DRAFT_416016 [Colletotrichum phormii]KAK1654554.1 hypothetical protein BDP81DRAFT_416016 [Colletotrichum phormii]